jgi:hypothetical protein
MAHQTDPRVRVLRKYGILVDADPDVLGRIPGRLPPVDGDMTFARWKKEIFGEAAEVGVFSLEYPSGNTRLKTLSGWGGEHVSQVLRHQTSLTRKRKQEELRGLEKELKSLEEALSGAVAEAHVPRDLLEMEVEELEGTLQNSVREFFNRQLPRLGEEITMEQLVKEMLHYMNRVAAEFSRAQAREDRLKEQVDQLQDQVEVLKGQLADQ